MPHLSIALAIFLAEIRFHLGGKFGQIRIDGAGLEAAIQQGLLVVFDMMTGQLCDFSAATGNISKKLVSTSL